VAYLKIAIRVFDNIDDRDDGDEDDRKGKPPLSRERESGARSK
jgi:hypothetical protein